MTSSINTNSLNVNYPVPGVNNNSQGFRDNFATIKTNLDAAGNEITDLQNKVVLKQALANSTLNNDMANTLISNALTRSFRASSYNLGNALSGTVTIDVSQADVQYGNIAANTTLQFTNWSPTNTQSNLQLVLNVGNANAVISFPSTVSNSNTVTSLENYANVANIATVTAPANITQLDYRFSTLDCGNTVIIEPFNRPRKAGQINTRTPANIGSVGDRAGTVCQDSTYLYVCTGTYDGSTAIWKSIDLSAVFGNTTTTNLSVSGNANVGNLGTSTAIITTGNITTINSGLLQNGTSNITIAPSGNVSVFVAGNATARTILTSTGANIAGYANVTGNANVGNIGATNGVFTGNISGNTNGYSLGYLTIPQVVLSSNVTLGLSDSGKHYFTTTSSNLAILVPNNSSIAFSIGTSVTVVNKGNANILINGDTGVSLYQAGSSSPGNITLGAYGMASLLKVESDTWFASGVGLT